jgi:regulatory protein RepA
MLLGGSSKGGKTFTLIHLALAVSAGRDWLSHKTVKNRVLYLNMEVDSASFVHRCIEVESHTGPAGQGNFDIWPLRGHSKPLNVLKKHLRKRIERMHYGIIILDPLYKMLMGDENSATDMAMFCLELDEIADKLGSSIVIASHFAKGAQLNKSAIDRISGSGVFGRDPDAVCTLTSREDLDEANNESYLEWTLREFAQPPKLVVEWVYPVHVVTSKTVTGKSAQSKVRKTIGDEILDLITGSVSQSITIAEAVKQTRAKNTTAVKRAVNTTSGLRLNGDKIGLDL